MATHTSFPNLFDDIASRIQSARGIKDKIKADDFPTAIAALADPMVLEVGATTVRTDASNTANYATNDRIRIHGDDGNDYTLAEWNALFAAAGFDKEAMTVEPAGIRVQAYGTDEVYLFDRYTGRTYNPVGDSQGDAGQLQHSLYNHALVTAAGSGTDSTTGKTWTVTEDGDNLILHEANTKQSWTIAKGTGTVNRHQAWNIAERVHSLWAQNEWLRHRMAIDSGLSTTEADGETTNVEILNASGTQAAVGEDMYFWIGGVNTNIPAKYNVNNRHTATAGLTQAIADAIYARQVANGINMNDTGVNSDSKPVLAPGSKGAEAIAVDGKWFIVTPFISNTSATVATATNNMADSPAVYWAKAKGCALPSDSLLDAMYNNKSLCNAVITYLNTVEGRSLPTIPTGAIWTAVRYSAYSCWYVLMSAGNVINAYTYLRYNVCGASASEN